ncbi:peptidylprolyl isomerase [Aquibaculum arenosum]|uniref:Peptidyl-prolyl cis-trans isomerase n=1 Tax=Aquibaculum arenosum TaxID=3032591 RepID=A0ABT5YIK3_9PROT|nr:peptidylprolyl isomerase [Fodinicurvata sp. CAU 1616]MDF2094771.1 peptidylprolyl isomerase [Fodinicurvata sp. CAU 1616]
MATAPEDTLVMELPSGRVIIALRPDLAPNHVARVKELVRDGFYDGLAFHRVIDGFMAQTGCPQGTGTGGSGRKLKAEFSNTPFKRGTIGAARTQDPNSADSQWFICFGDASWLNGQYTVWGEVVEGMEAVDGLSKAPASDPSGSVPKPDKIVSIKVQADAA